MKPTAARLSANLKIGDGGAPEVHDVQDALQVFA